MWYDILVKNKYAEYFINSNGTEDAETTAKMIRGLAGIVSGATTSWAFCDRRYADFVAVATENMDADERLAFEFCHSNLDSTAITSLSDVWQSIPTEDGQFKYDVDVALLSAEQCAVLIMYPFWSRMGGSFEEQFAADGRLKKYLHALNKKIK